MITAQAHLAQPRWQQLWRDTVRDPRELLRLLDLPDLAATLSDAAAAQFPLRMPRGFVARMRRVGPHDPLLRQVLPVLDEDRIAQGFNFDAVGTGADALGLAAAISRWPTPTPDACIRH